MSRVDTTFAADLPADQRASLLETAIADLSTEARDTLVALEPGDWPIVRTESARVLDALLRAELRDTTVAETRTRLAGLMAGGLDAAQRALAAELIGPLVVPNASFSATLTAQAEARAAARRHPGAWSRSSRTRPWSGAASD